MPTFELEEEDLQRRMLLGFPAGQSVVRQTITHLSLLIEFSA
jgi:hypothetical protein